MPGSSAQSTRAGNRCPHNSWVWKSAVVLSARQSQESVKHTGALLKKPTWRERGADWSCVRKGWSLWLCRETWGDSCWEPCAELFPHNADSIFLGCSNVILKASAWENAIASPSGLPVSPPSRTHTLLRSQFSMLRSRDLGILRGYQCQWCGFGVGVIPPTFPWTWLVPHPHRRSFNPTVLTPDDFSLLTSGHNLGKTEWYAWGVGATPLTFPQPQPAPPFMKESQAPPS